MGIVPKLVIGGLALIGLVTLVGWVTSFVFGLTKGVLIVAILMLAGLWLRARFRHRPARD